MEDTQTPIMTDEDMQKAQCALYEFVKEWNLPMNPEEMDVVIYAIMAAQKGDLTYEEITAQTKELLKKFNQ